jgi:hypothetical protein
MNKLSRAVGWSEDKFRHHPGPLVFAVLTCDLDVQGRESFDLVARMEAPFNVGEPWARALERQVQEEHGHQVLSGILRVPELEITDAQLVDLFILSVGESLGIR